MKESGREVLAGVELLSGVAVLVRVATGNTICFIAHSIECNGLFLPAEALCVDLCAEQLICTGSHAEEVCGDVHEGLHAEVLLFGVQDAVFTDEYFLWIVCWSV